MTAPRAKTVFNYARLQTIVNKHISNARAIGQGTPKYIWAAYTLHHQHEYKFNKGGHPKGHRGGKMLP